MKTYKKLLSFALAYLYSIIGVKLLSFTGISGPFYI